MRFKTLPDAIASRIATRPLDYEWNVDIGNGFLAAFGDASPRLSDALERLNIHGAADLVLGAAEWCFARTRENVDPADGMSRLQAAWASTVDPRYLASGHADVPKATPAMPWSQPERQVRRRLAWLGDELADGGSAKVRQLALGTILLAEHLCGREPAFGAWLADMLRAKTASSPRRADDVDHTSRDMAPPTPQELTMPSREERLSGLDPATNPYLRSAADMAALGFVGDPYPRTP